MNNYNIHMVSLLEVLTIFKGKEFNWINVIKCDNYHIDPRLSAKFFPYMVVIIMP